MRYIVTGGNGFVGTNLIKELLVKGHEVISIDNLSIGKKDNEVSGVKYIYEDVNNINNIEGLDNIDGIFHLAGLSRIQPSFDNPTETFRANTDGTQAVCEWSKNNGKPKIVYAGSSSKHHDPYKSPYALFKYLGEEICKMYRKSFNMEIEVCRFYNVYGPGEIVDGDWAAVIGIWRRQIRDKEPITIVGDGEQRRDFTHVYDIVDGLIKIMESNHIASDAWELGTGLNYSINEVFDIFKIRFPNIESIGLPDQSGNYRKTLRENNDAITKLNWWPSDKLREYILNL